MPEAHRRVYRYGTEPIADDQPSTPVIGPENRDWWTIEIDIIPPDPEGWGESYTASIINRRTGQSRTYEARMGDFYGYYEAIAALDVNRAKELAAGEAIGTLFAAVRDHYDLVISNDPKPD